MDRAKKTTEKMGMKLIIVLMVILCGNGYGQTKILWQKSLGGSGHCEHLSNSIILRNGYLFVSQSSASNAVNDVSKQSYDQFGDIWLIRTDSFGNKIWDKTYGTDTTDFVADCINLDEGGFLVGATVFSVKNKDKLDTFYGGKDIWIIKLDSNGNKIWDKTYGGDKDDIFKSFIKIKGGYLLGGYSYSDSSGNKFSKRKNTNPTNSNYWVIKIDSVGNKLWDKSYGNTFDELNKIVKINDNKFLLGGMSASDSGGDKSQKNRPSGGDFWILLIDSNGTKIWDKRYGSIGNQGINDIKVANDGIYLGGNTYQYSDTSYDMKSLRTFMSNGWIVKIDFNGNIIWEKLVGGSRQDEFFKMLVTKDSGIVLAMKTSSIISYDRTYTFGTFGFDPDYFIVKIDKNGNKLWDLSFGGNNMDYCNDVIYSLQGNLLISGFSNSIPSNIGNKTTNKKGDVDLWIVEFKQPNFKIKGSVFPDFNSNCLYNKPSEYNIPKITIHNKTENTYAITNDSIYTMYLFDHDTAVLKIINLDSNLYVACGKDSIVVDMTGKTDTAGIDFPIRSNKTGHCINITSFSSGLLRPGRWGDYQLNYQNNAFDTAYNAYIEIEVDTAAIDSIKSPYSFTLTGTILRFNLGHVRPFGFSSVSYSIKLKTTVIIGSSHCHRAKVFPICNLYPTTVYDSSEIQPMMRCLPNDTIEFTLKNIGLRDQKDWGHSIIYVDELILKKDSFKLTVGNSRVFKYKLDTNKVFTAEVFNSNFHPVTPILIRHNDLCANRRPMIPQNAALNFSRHDEAKEYEEACTIVRGSYDPNIKSVQPVGMFAEHYTSTGTELKYRIDFQNTGTDTAFRVVLIDTLSSFLDIASFVPGVSSHPYYVEFGGRAVKFIFDPISLIDSGKNEPASHGYVHFKIKHIAGISPKTKIENMADIYFDYNAPVRTNTVFNTIFDTIQIYVPKAGDTAKGKDSTNSIQGVNQTSILIFPNPTTDKFFIQMSEPVKDLSIEIYDMQGRKIKSVSSANNQTVEVSALGMTKGIYHIRCMSGEKLIVVKKVMVE